MSTFGSRLAARRQEAGKVERPVQASAGARCSRWGRFVGGRESPPAAARIDVVVSPGHFPPRRRHLERDHVGPAPVPSSGDAIITGVVWAGCRCGRQGGGREHGSSVGALPAWSGGTPRAYLVAGRARWEAEVPRGSVSHLSHSTPPVRPRRSAALTSSCAPKWPNKNHLGAVGERAVVRAQPRAGKTNSRRIGPKDGGLDPLATRDRSHASLIYRSTGSLMGADPRAEDHEDTRDRDS